MGLQATPEHAMQNKCLLLTCSSHDIPLVLNYHVFPDQPPSWRKCFLHVGHVAIPGSSSRGVLGRPDVVDLPQFRDISRFDSICQWPMDECWGLLSVADNLKSFLEIRLPLHRLCKLKPSWMASFTQ